MIRIGADIFEVRAAQRKTLSVIVCCVAYHVGNIPLCCKYVDNINILFGYLFV